MPFMQLQTIRKGALYSADCAKCGHTCYTHEWVNDDHNERRDAMEAGTLACDECPGTVNKETFTKSTRPQYACRYSAPGYMDATDWSYGANRRKLEREVRDLYGDTDPELQRDAQGRFLARGVFC